MFALKALRATSSSASSGLFLSRATLATLASRKAQLELATGEKFNATSFGAERSLSGELVFTTSLVGYPESMTDPSYRGQILVFTQPLIGNYGVPGDDKDEFGISKYFESDGIQVEGIIVSNYAAKYSHWTAVESLGEWCQRYNVPALSDIDTRALTKLLRVKGSSMGRITFGDDLVPFENPNKKNLVAEVSTKEIKVFNKGGSFKVGLLDCGVKNNIIRCLAKRGAEVHLLPWDTDLLKHQFDGIFLSNGPGDPSTCTTAVNNLKALLESTSSTPIFGICMGNLLLGLAAGGQSYKLKHGNRGHNQPAMNLVTGKGVITSQNHGYAIRPESLPPAWRPFFVNVNDGSNEGLIHSVKPISSVQFHPEFMGGPQDSEYLFDSFMEQVKQYKKAQDDTDLKAAFA